MKSFSPVEDALEGFRLIGRRPGSVIVWILVWAVLAVGPVIAGALLVWPHLADLMGDLRDMDSGGAAFDRFVRLEMTCLGLLAPWLLWVVAVQSVINTAIFRAVLEPRSGGLAGLKLGVEEVRQFLLQIILFLMWLVFLGVVIGLSVAVGVAARDSAPAYSGWLIALIVIAALCLTVYVPIKFSLAGPTTFAHKRLDVFGSWRKTRGRFWSLLGMALICLLFVLAVAMVLGALRNLAFYGFNWGQLDALNHLGDDPRTVLPVFFRAVGPGLLASMVVQGIAHALMQIVLTAPFAAAYRDLTAAPPVVAADDYAAAPASV